ncbi:MAG: transposase [Acidobacteria bacterium]|nr:transposase [Acidobacteriota bacterium]
MPASPRALPSCDRCRPGRHLLGQRPRGAYGYNRDGKKGKKQIVIGLLCDEQGEPVSTEVFRGNTQDTATFASQVKKASQRFGCQEVTFVGDRGMIKSGQIEELSRRNPCRAEELAASRADKQASVERLCQQRNRYLREHPHAKVPTAEKAVRDKIAQLKLEPWLRVEVQARSLKLIVEGNSKIGFVKGEGRLTLTAEGDATSLTYDGDVHVGGAFAAVGQRLLDTTAKMMIKRFFEKLCERGVKFTES